MRLGLKAERAGLAPAAQLLVFGIILANGHGFVGNIGDREQKRLHFGGDRVDLFRGADPRAGREPAAGLRPDDRL